MKKVFIDGSAGTTGLRIHERLSQRPDLELVILDGDLRKDPAARKAAIDSSDVAFLCLPDAAAIEAVSLSENPETVIIDTSTAHRTNDAWAYGFAEIGSKRRGIAVSKRIANPGCHASGFIALVEPLVSAGIIPADAALSSFSLTGYSGGGKKMIADYEAAATPLHSGGRQYALGQTHKHLPEMVKYCGLKKAPVFSPIVVPHLSGMEVTVQLFADAIKGTLAEIKDCFRDYYSHGGLVHFEDDPSEGGFISSQAYSGRDDLEVSAYGNDSRIILVARFDNLGKGASGAAIQNMNIALGCDEKTGLVISF